MIHPYLFVGVGGSGGKTLRALKKELEQSLTERNWDFEKFGFPITWQFLSIDTPAVQGREGFPAETLSTGEYLGLATNGQSLDTMLTSIQSRFANSDPLLREEVLSPLPLKGSYKKLIDEGAGQYRGIGRTVALARFTAIRDAVATSLRNMQGPMWQEHQAALANLFSKNSTNESSFKPTIFLISSLAGGSGSGQFLEVSEAIKAARPNDGDSWVGEQIAILYAPDVFDDPKITHVAGIAPNSLSAIGELVSAKWRKAPTEVNASIYAANGFADFKKANYKVGPSDVFLFGKSAGNVIFSSQNDVYLATASSLAHWVTDPKISEWFNVFQRMNQQLSPDPSGLMVDNHLPFAFNSFGFSRVTLGSEQFKQYAVGRLSRATLQALVYGHVDRANESDESLTEEQKIEKIVRQRFIEFRDSLQIFPEQIARALQPDAKIADWLAAYKADVSRLAEVNGSQSQKATDWIARIRGALSQATPTKKSDWESTRKIRIEEWAEVTQNRINAVVARESAIYGLRTAEALLGKIIEAIGQKSANEGARQLPDPGQKVQEALQMSSSSVLPGASGQVQQAISDAVTSTKELLQMEDLRFARKILDDLVANYLVPLRNLLLRSHNAYLQMVATSDYRGTGVNEFKSWPDGTGGGPRPPQNIKLLVPHTNYESEFMKLLEKSTGEKSPEAAIQTAVIEILSDSKLIRGMEQESSDRHAWASFGKNSTSWLPYGGTKSSTPWIGSLPKDLGDWQAVVDKYVMVPVRPLAQKINESLYDWLTPKEIDLRTQRENDFVAAFASALSMCRPFAKLNQSLLQEAHGLHNEEYSLTVSSIPVTLSYESGSLSDRLRDSLATRGLTGEEAESKFFGESANVKSIDFFAALKSPVHHFVFDNVTKPIIEAWNLAKNDPKQREEFLLNRRSRLLPEAIPMAPEKLEQLLRGWYVGQILGRLKEEKTYGPNGPRLFVHKEDPSMAGFEPLPYPLLSKSSQFPMNDWPALVAYSVNLALLECADKGNMRPFSPYKSLLDLGGPVTIDNITHSEDQTPAPIPLAESLQDWISRGEVAPLAPTPPLEAAGSAQMSVEERKTAILGFLQKQRADFIENNVDLQAGRPHTTLGWQMRRETLSALDTLISGVSDFKAMRSYLQ
jgi:hypothetical protein